MHTINVELLKKILPKEYLTITSKSIFTIKISDENLIIKAKGRIVSYPIKTLSLVMENIILSHSIAVPLFWREYTKNKRDYFYLRVLAIDYLSKINESEIKFIARDTIKFCNKPPVSLYEPIQQSTIISNHIVESVGKNYSSLTLLEEMNHDLVEIVAINYATTRKPTFDEQYYDQQRDDKINFGVAHVSIPKLAHRPGNIESPYKFLGIKISEKDPAKHFTVHENTILNEEIFINVLSKADNSEKIIVFLHGFNVSFEEAVYKAAQIKYDIQIKHPMLLLSWPSCSSAKDYAYDKQSTISSSILFSKLFDLLETNDLFDGKEIVVIAHSMGNMLLSQIVSHMKNPCSRFTNVALAAADVTQFEFTNFFISYFRNVFKKISIYVNQKDKALWVSKKINKTPLVGDSSQQVCIHPAIETIDTTGFNGKLGELYHSYYASDEKVLNDIREFLIDSLPASKRTLNVKYTPNKEQYWSLA